MSSLVNLNLPADVPHTDGALDHEALWATRIPARDFSPQRWSAAAPQSLLLTGELDAGTAILGRRRLHAALHAGRGPLILDCSSVEFIDAAWLGVLVGISNYGGRIGRQVVVAAPSPRVARLLRLVGLQWLTANG